MRHILSVLILGAVGACSTNTHESKEQALAVQALRAARLGDSVQSVEKDLKNMGFTCSIGIAHTGAKALPAYPVLDCTHPSLGNCRLDISVHAPGGKVGSTALTFARVSGPIGATTCGP
jgi:hypothetical protein